MAALALVIALGGGTAWAANHYLITKTSQIKPSVLAKLHGAVGRAGVTGTPGVRGATGGTGVTGATGTAATVFDTQIDPQTGEQQTGAAGAIPIVLSCVQNGGSAPQARLDASPLPDPSSRGRYTTTMTANNGTNTSSAAGPLSTSVFTPIADSGPGAVTNNTYGTSVLTTFVGGNFKTETVTFWIFRTDDGSSGTCYLKSQITTEG